jgi:hypothetical protein
MRNMRDSEMIQTGWLVFLLFLESRGSVKTKETLLDDLLVKERLHELEMAYWRGVDIPTIWMGIVGPGGMLPAIVSNLNEEINAVLRGEEMSAMLAGQSLTPLSATPQHMEAQIKAEIVAWGAVIRKLGIQLDLAERRFLIDTHTLNATTSFYTASNNWPVLQAFHFQLPNTTNGDKHEPA